MANMNPTELIIRTIDGEPTSRIPTFCAGNEDRTFQDVLGKPLIKNAKILQNPIVKFALNKWGPALTPIFVQTQITTGMKKRIEASVKLGFDSTWAIYDETFTAINSRQMTRFTGSLFEMRNDGFGNMTYYYIEPAIHNRKEFEEWSWPDIPKIREHTYKFYKKMIGKYGDKICLMGQGSAYGIFETLMWTLGLGQLARWVRKEKDLIQRYIEMAEELCIESAMAMMDAGVKVIMQPDDMAFKTGPMMNPKQIDELFGPSYTRMGKRIHEREGKYLHHKCGDNTDLFEYLVKWRVDGAHALENTCYMDVGQIKKQWGDKITLIGGVGIDYLLTEDSQDEEVDQFVKEFIQKMGPGGRFIIGPTHSETSVPGRKLTVMLDAVKKYGNYPIKGN
ncbi:MAG: uroporphyrinogen decarboxylase family protein [Promethearchaeota archaeon]